MTTKKKIAAALALLALAAATFWSVSRSTSPVMPKMAPAADAPAKPMSTVPRRRRADVAVEAPAAEAKSADATTDVAAGDVERAKWPIRVTTNVPGADVTMQLRFYGGDADPPSETKTTDARGFAGFGETVGRGAPARIEFIARAAGWATRRTSVDAPGDVTIELWRGVSVRGRVTDASGAAVSRAVVQRTGANWTASDGEGIKTLAAETDRDGAFEIFVQRPGAATLRVEHPAFLPRNVAVIAPADGLVVVLDRGFEVLGRVAFPDGRPLPGATILDPEHRVRATTDADGRYDVSGLARGPITLTRDIVDESRTVEASATGADFVVDRPVARVRLLGPDRRLLRFAGADVRVDKNGANLYWKMLVGGGAVAVDHDELVPGTPGAKLVVTAHAGAGETGGASMVFESEPRVIDVDVVIGAAKPTGAIRLVVRSDAAETPHAVCVVVRSETGGTVAGGWRTRFELDAAGSVEIPNVPAGRVVATVSGESADTPLVAVRPSAVVEAGRTTEIEATLLVGGRLRAVLRDESGRALAPQRVELTTSSNGRYPDDFMRRLSDGEWTSKLDTSPSELLNALAPGRYVVRATTQGGEDVEKEVEVRRGETVDVELTAKSKR